MTALRHLLTIVMVAAFVLWPYALNRSTMGGSVSGGVLLLVGLLIVWMMGRASSKFVRISQIGMALVLWVFSDGMKIEGQEWYYWVFTAALVAAVLRPFFRRSASSEPGSTSTPIGKAKLIESQRYTGKAIGKGWVYGNAGGNISSGGAGFGDEQVKAGTRGEQVVGALLESYASQYGGVVVHGLRFDPRNLRSKADVDHALIVGDNELWLIDAKMWAGGDYEWKDSETIWRDGAPFKGGTVHMEDADTKWVSAFGRGNHIRTFIVMALKGKSRYRVRNKVARSGRVSLMSLHDFERYLRDNPPRPINDWSLANRVVESML